MSVIPGTLETLVEGAQSKAHVMQKAWDPIWKIIEATRAGDVTQSAYLASTGPEFKPQYYQ
jgi:hypothetical protein